MKYYDNVTFVIQQEDPEAPGNFKEYEITKPYMGDWKRIESKWVGGSNLIDDKRVNNQLEIISDPFAVTNFTHIRYVKWMGQTWSVNTVTLRPPRIVMEIGGLYNASKEPLGTS